MANADLENERKQLRDLLKETLIAMGDIEKMGDCLEVLRKKSVKIYKELDKKLNGD